MKLEDLYNIVKNPLNDDKTIKKILNCFMKAEEKDDFYDQFTRVQRKEYTKLFSYNNENNDFWKVIDKYKNIQLFIFNTYKKYLYKIDYNSCDKGEKILKDFYNNNPLNSVDDLEDFKINWENHPLCGWFDNMSPLTIPFGVAANDDEYWCFLISNKIPTEGKLNYKNNSSVEETYHRLYINIDFEYYDRLVIPFVEQCLKNKIPFISKFMALNYLNYNESRDDSFVSYTNSKYIMKQIEILNSIIENDEVLKNNIYEAPLLTGKIGKYIGYGAEPKEKHSSYNIKRCEILYNVIIDYITNISINININEHNEEIISKLSIILKEKLQKEKEKYEKKFKSIKEKNRIIEIDNILNNENCDKIFYDQAKDMYDKNNKNDILIKRAINSMIIESIINKKEHIENIRKQIIEKCDSNYIDSNSFCFDPATLEEIQEEINKNNKESEIKRQT